MADNLEALDRVAAAHRSVRCAWSASSSAPATACSTRPPSAPTAAVVGTYRKRLLPNYAVFDEQRYFDGGHRGRRPLPHRRASWSASRSARTPGGRTARSPTSAGGGAELIVNLNASPYHAGKVGERERMLAARAAEAGCPIVYVNQVGGQDELVFDGASIVVDDAAAPC